jgi:5-methylcytosine-specific restriction endonuclease McrA
MKMIEKNCLNCGNIFTTRLSEHKRGYGKYCSLSCASNHNKVLKIHEPNVTCAYCNKPFYKSESKQLVSRSGLYFCCREHKDLGQRINSGIVEIHPPHYNNGKYNYRAIARREKPLKCERCGYDEHPQILEVHHKDKNRSNNDVQNLEILCPNCHMIEHRVKL